jgi:mannose-6-phosphate isomerase-like protein (cupin superfamily)
VIPRRVEGLRAAVVVLKPGGCMAWHSTQAREEVLIPLAGRVVLETRTLRGRQRCHALSTVRCAYLPARTLHRVVNASSTEARYLYVTAPSNEKH